MNQSVLISKVKGSYNRSSILLLSWTFEVWYLHWLDHASLSSHFDFERLMNLSRVKHAILSSKWVLVVKPRTGTWFDIDQSINYQSFSVQCSGCLTPALTRKILKIVSNSNKQQLFIFMVNLDTNKMSTNKTRC